MTKDNRKVGPVGVGDRPENIVHRRSKRVVSLKAPIRNRRQTLQKKLPREKVPKVSKGRQKDGKWEKGLLEECVICSKLFSSQAHLLKSTQEQMIRFLVDELFILAATPTNPKPKLTSTSLSRLHICPDCSKKAELAMDYSAQVKNLEQRTADLSKTFKDLVNEAIASGTAHPGSKLDTVVHQIRNFIAESSQLTKRSAFPDLKESPSPFLDDNFDCDFDMNSDVEINPSKEPFNDEEKPAVDNLNRVIQEATFVENADAEDFVFEEKIKVEKVETNEETSSDPYFLEEGAATFEQIFIEPEPDEPVLTEPFYPSVDSLQKIMETEIYPVLERAQGKENSIINGGMKRDKRPIVLIHRLIMPHDGSRITRSKLKRDSNSVTANKNLDNLSSSEEEKEAHLSSAESSKLESSSSEEDDSDCSTWERGSKKRKPSPKKKLKTRLRRVRTYSAKKYVWCCKLKFPVESQQLLDHYSTAHETQTKFTCLICSSVFISVLKLRRHSKKIHSTTPTPFSFQCNTCQKRLGSIKELRRCKRAHEVNNKVSHPRPPSTLIPFQCHRCSVVFSDDDALASHISSAFERDNLLKFSCQSCLKPLYTSYQVKVHIQKAHPDVFRAKCLLCDDIPVLTSFEEVRGHRQLVHPHFAKKSALEVIYKAQSPTEYFKAVEEKRGKRAPRQYKPLPETSPDIDEKRPCHEDNCDVVCKNKKLLAHHRIMTHGRWQNPDLIQCKVCHKRVKHAWCMDIHMKSHSNERPVLCSQCGATFKDEFNLKRHSRNVHDKEKNYACGTCGKGFFGSSKLKNHEAIHKEDRPFLCSECGKSFKTKNNLYIHGWSHDPNRKRKYPVYMSKAVRSKKKKAGNDEKGVDKSDLLESSCPAVPPESSSSVLTAISIPSCPPIPEVTAPSSTAYPHASSESASQGPDPEVSIPTVLYDADNRVPYAEAFFSTNPSLTIL